MILLIISYFFTVKILLSFAVNKKLNALSEISGYRGNLVMIEQYFKNLRYEADVKELYKDLDKDLYSVEVNYGLISVKKLFKWNYSHNKAKAAEIKNLIQEYWKKNKTKSEEEKLNEIEEMIKKSNYYYSDNYSVFLEKNDNKIIVKFPTVAGENYSKELERFGIYDKYKDVIVVEIN